MSRGAGLAWLALLLTPGETSIAAAPPQTEQAPDYQEPRISDVAVRIESLDPQAFDTSTQVRVFFAVRGETQDSAPTDLDIECWVQDEAYRDRVTAEPGEVSDIDVGEPEPDVRRDSVLTFDRDPLPAAPEQCDLLFEVGASSTDPATQEEFCFGPREVARGSCERVASQ